MPTPLKITKFLLIFSLLWKRPQKIKIRTNVNSLEKNMNFKNQGIRYR